MPFEQRVAHWEAECRNHRVGLRRSPHTHDGLLARQTCVDLEVMRVADVRANAPVIDRTPEMIRDFPRDSIFVNLVCQDDVFVCPRGHCMNLQRDDDSRGALAIRDQFGHPGNRCTAPNSKDASRPDFRRAILSRFEPRVQKSVSSSHEDHARHQ